MTNSIALRPSVLLALCSLAACATAPDVRPESSSACGSGEAIAFYSGTGTGARVTRTALPDGSERLHGETEIVLGARSKRCVVEDVTLDPRGRLTRGEIAVAASCAGDPEARVTLDPASGTVASAGARWSVPTDAPWVYAPEVVPGKITVTPVSAWVARRAAIASPALVEVRLAHNDAWKVPSEQIAVPTENGTTIVLGGDGADVSPSFVERIRMVDYGVTLVRAAGAGQS
jgi:hypothetical protein